MGTFELIHQCQHPRGNSKAMFPEEETGSCSFCLGDNCIHINLQRNYLFFGNMNVMSTLWFIQNVNGIYIWASKECGFHDITAILFMALWWLYVAVMIVPTFLQHLSSTEKSALHNPPKVQRTQGCGGKISCLLTYYSVTW